MKCQEYIRQLFFDRNKQILSATIKITAKKLIYNKPLALALHKMLSNTNIYNDNIHVIVKQEPNTFLYDLSSILL